MSYSIILSERALTELTNSWLWYEDKQEGLGEKFRLAVYSQFSHIALNPFIGIKRKRVYFENILKQFPYIIIYRVDKRNRTVFVSSIFHTSRNPSNKYK